MTRGPVAERAWMVMRAGHGRGWGGEIRRARIFEELAVRTNAGVVDDWPSFQRVILGRRWQRPFRRDRPGPHLAASETAPLKWLERIVTMSDPVAVAIYDDPVAQARALGLPLDAGREADLASRRRANERAFRWHVVPTASFAELAGLDPERTVVGGNGTVASLVRPGPWPTVPLVGFVSGAAPGRGIEILIEAMREVRATNRDAQLALWLVATGEQGVAYLADLRATAAAEPWLTIESTPYARLGETLSSATVLAIPHPANEYMDVALPVKLLDSMAAGRPLVVTPRTETARIVSSTGAGLVTTDDAPSSIAASIARLLDDEELARTMGAAGRAAAERDWDWPVVGARIADEILRREGR